MTHNAQNRTTLDLGCVELQQLWFEPPLVMSVTGKIKKTSKLFANFQYCILDNFVAYLSRKLSQKQLKHQLSAKFRLLAMTYTNRQSLFITTAIDTVRNNSRTADEQLLVS